jgi:hypothetical protein
MATVTAKRRTTLVVLLAATAGLGIAGLPPATAGTGGVPFEARLSGTAAFTSPTTVEFHGTGQATHMGRIVAGGAAILDPPTGSCPSGAPGIPNVHTETLAAANGDELTIRMVDVACPTGPSTFHGTGNWTVVGGTGRFEHTTGEGTAEGDADFAMGTLEFRLTGTLSLL